MWASKSWLSTIFIVPRVTICFNTRGVTRAVPSVAFSPCVAQGDPIRSGLLWSSWSALMAMYCESVDWTPSMARLYLI